MSRYFEKHLQAHRSLGAFAFVSQQTEEVRKQLQQTEEDLKQLKAKAGIPALAENTETVTAAMIKANSDLQAARVELAEQRARVAEIKNSIASGHSPSLRGAQLTGDGGIRQYEDLSADVSRLRQEELNLLAKYTPESRAVQIRRTQIDDLENQRRAIEMKLPAISNARNFKDTSPLSVLNLLSERSRLAQNAFPITEPKLPNLSATKISRKRTISILKRVSKKRGSMRRLIPPGFQISAWSKSHRQPRSASLDI